MKTTLFLSLALLVAMPGRAQVLRPEAVKGAVIGGVAGAVVGNNSRDLRNNGARGAAIGAATGLVVGQVVGNSSAGHARVARPGQYIYRQPPAVTVGVHVGNRGGYGRGYGHYGSSYYGSGGYGYGSYGGYYGPNFGYYPGYDVSVYPFGTYGYGGSGSAAANGLWLGALAGGIIGNNSGAFHHDGWRGAAWGAGLGWLLGSVADASQRSVAYPAQTPVTGQAAPAVAQPPQQVTIINNYYNAPATPMTEANSLFGRK